MVPNLAQSLAKNADSFWRKDTIYQGRCAGAWEGGKYPACYSSKPKFVKFDPKGWAAYYERIFSLHKREMDYLLDNYEKSFGAAPTRVFLFGNSEGGMVASRYTHPKLVKDWKRESGSGLAMRGRILSAWSCEDNYFVSCSDSRKIGEPTVPVLNLLSDADPYFGNVTGNKGSVSALVGSRTGAPLTGSCAAKMRNQGVKGVAIKLKQPYHGNLNLAGSFFRAAVVGFVRNPDTFNLGGGAPDLNKEDAKRMTKSILDGLCEDVQDKNGVLSANCKDVLPQIPPVVPSEYDEMKFAHPDPASHPVLG